MFLIPHAHLTLALKRKKKKNAQIIGAKYEAAKNWEMSKIEVIPVVIGALGTVTKHFQKWIEKLDLDLTIEGIQKPCLLGTSRIIRKVLDMK